MASNLDLLQSNAEESKEVAVPLATVQNDNSVFIGEALSEDDKLNLLMTDTKPYITVLVGFEGYGKTSFVATCYHIMLTDGGIGKYKFCDSDTLVGLERRSFLRRFNEVMEGISSSTKRTIRGEAHLLTFHLSKDGNEKITIFSDHSGEDYRQYADQKDKIREDVLIQNADRILFFIDIPSLLDTRFLQMVQDYKNLLSNIYSPVSTPADFRQLTPYVFRLALQQSGVDILEPMLCFELQIPQVASSKAITDLQKLMSEIEDISCNNEWCHIKGKVPLNTSKDYASEVSSYTKGLGIFMVKPCGYQITKDGYSDNIRMNEKDKLLFMFQKSMSSK